MAADDHLLEQAEQELPAWSLWRDEDGEACGGMHDSGYKLGPMESVTELVNEARRLTPLLAEFAEHKWMVSHNVSHDIWFAEHMQLGTVEAKTLPDLAFSAYLARYDRTEPDLPRDLWKSVWLEGWHYEGDTSQGRPRFVRGGEAWEPTFDELCYVYSYEPQPAPAAAPAPAPAADRHAVHYSSESGEWYTPPHIITLVRDVLGVIDLDPASCAAANETVKAHRYYDQAAGGLGLHWHGRVWLNPPYGDQIGQWTRHLVEEYEAGNVDAALALLPARPDTQWFRPLFDYPRCWVFGRLRFGDGRESAPFPSVVVYLGPDVARFRAVFGTIGYVDVPVEVAEVAE
jgi:hypothetical protein